MPICRYCGKETKTFEICGEKYCDYECFRKHKEKMAKELMCSK